MRCCDQLAPRSTDRLAVLASPVPVIGSQSSALTFHLGSRSLSHIPVTGSQILGARSPSARSPFAHSPSDARIAVLNRTACSPQLASPLPRCTNGHTDRHAVSDPHWGWEPHVGSCMGEAPTILTVACCPRACPMRDGVRSRMFPDRVRGTCMLNGSCARRGMSAGCTCRLSGAAGRRQCVWEV